MNKIITSIIPAITLTMLIMILAVCDYQNIIGHVSSEYPYQNTFCLLRINLCDVPEYMEYTKYEECYTCAIESENGTECDVYTFSYYKMNGMAFDFISEMRLEECD